LVLTVFFPGSIDSSVAKLKSRGVSANK
jgi:hypothetical protein